MLQNVFAAFRAAALGVPLNNDGIPEEVLRDFIFVFPGFFTSAKNLRSDINLVKHFNFMEQLRICHHKTQGLHNDYTILAESFSSYVVIHEVYTELDYIQNTKLGSKNFVFVNIFLEHIYKEYLGCAQFNIFIPNIEWLNMHDFRACNSVDQIWCKTKFAFDQLFQIKTLHHKLKMLGFSSIDRYNPSFEKLKGKIEVLHLKGISKYKNSQLVLDTWLKNPHWPMLHLVHYGHHGSNGFLDIKEPVLIKSNITLYQTKLSENDLINLMNKCHIHICCSFAEGFGHYINEALSTNALVVTTDGYPMKELVGKNNILIPPMKIISVNLSKGYLFDEEMFSNQLQNVFRLSCDEIVHQGGHNRLLFLKRHEDFKSNCNLYMSELLNNNFQN